MASVYEDAKAYNEYVSAAVDLSDGHVNMDGLLTVIRSVRDIDQNKRRRYLYHIPLEAGSGLSIPPTELSDQIQIRLPSPTGCKIAIFRREESDEKKKVQILELWVQSALVRRILLSDKVHGNIINDGSGFGDPSWSSDETHLVYVAERNPPETESFFDGDYDAFQHGNNDENDALKHRGGKFLLGLGQTESWGEQYSKQSALLDLIVVNVNTGQLSRVANCPGADDKSSIAGYSLGQPIFSPDGRSIVYTAWDAGGGGSMPRRLGLVYCQQRPSSVYSSTIKKLVLQLSKPREKDEVMEFDAGYTNLSPNISLARSPRFSPVDDDGTCTLVYLSSKNGFDTHSGCLGLHSLSWNVDAPDLTSLQEVIAPVMDPRLSSTECGTVCGLQFPGFFLRQLPKHPFISNNCLLVTTQWGSCSKIVRVSLTEKKVVLVNDGDDMMSAELIALVQDGNAIVSLKKPNEVPSLWKFTLKASASYSSGEVEQQAVMPAFGVMLVSRFSAVLNVPGLSFSSVRQLHSLPKVDEVDGGIPIQSILLLPTAPSANKPPLIVVPHGGPHSVSSTSYIPSYAYLCGHGGYAILMVNYRGSTGFGQTMVESLLTRIGDLDVKDVVAATREVAAAGLVDPDRIGICGGSHGGFLTGHCTGQYPDLFKAAAMRNPVVNLPSMVTATDIPDWCYVEGMGSYKWDEYHPPLQKDLNILWDKSPIRYISSVKTPTLVALGLSDLRVPPSQGLEWYHSLRSMSVPTKLLRYAEDDHAIAGVVSEGDHWINIKRWFDEHL